MGIRTAAMLSSAADVLSLFVYVFLSFVVVDIVRMIFSYK